MDRFRALGTAAGVSSAGTFCRGGEWSVATGVGSSPLRPITFTLRPLLVITRITVTLRPGGPLYAYHAPSACPCLSDPYLVLVHT